jgi:hypothetical protein
MSPLHELLVRLAPEHLAAHGGRMPHAQVRALESILSCRTPALGGSLMRCTGCEREVFTYHSCNHRACPQCGGRDTGEWTLRQTERLLPVPYFLVTFTLPEPLRALARDHPVPLLDLLFNASSQALKTVASLPRQLGGQLGFTGFLHTWTRQLAWHPHVHYIVAGGGLSPEGKRWIECRQPDWLFPVKLLSAEYRKAMDEALRARQPALHAQVPPACWSGPWVVHCQSAGSGANVVRYLARYVHRTALSDERLGEAKDGKVTISYTDSTTGKPGRCTFTQDEFLRRYLQHVLPPGLKRIRYYGWMHPSAVHRRMIVENLLGKGIALRDPPPPPPDWSRLCPHCEQFLLVEVRKLHPVRGRFACHRRAAKPP